MLARDLSGAEVLTAFAGIEPLGWKVFVEQPIAEVYATLNATILRTGFDASGVADLRVHCSCGSPAAWCAYP